MTRKIGGGGFGEIYEGIDLVTKEQVVIIIIIVIVILWMIIIIIMILTIILSMESGFDTFSSANNSPMIDTIHAEMINSLIFILTEEGE